MSLAIDSCVIRGKAVLNCLTLARNLILFLVKIIISSAIMSPGRECRKAVANIVRLLQNRGEKRELLSEIWVGVM
jgi:hypothetical protein